jgi:hypothetical protein
LDVGGVVAADGDHRLKVDTTWALVWHLDAAGMVDRVVNSSAIGAACRLKVAAEGGAWMTPCW